MSLAKAVSTKSKKKDKDKDMGKEKVFSQMVEDFSSNAYVSKHGKLALNVSISLLLNVVV